ncbi:uncharacterized protein LOC112556877 isoform X2 [Pomacea canaliculata]|uniref:uncharacterized protein LOC112556877 isoform X2 n=1 Tax=Pomacea canaliculata TaxID=400727 RepID=UPI000D72BA7B|nr:uncharacterized protein LOC112556877 isoform X2 [Pomacea canaliculata]
MESEDDIYILGSEEDEVDWGSHFFSPPSPFRAQTADTGSHHALQKAYLELKKRFNETSLRNQTLQQRINQLETLRGTGLINMNEDNMSYSAQGGAAMPGAVEAQMAAEEGFVTMLQRDLLRQKAQVQRLSTIEVKYQDVLRQNESLKQQLASLSQAVNEKGGNSSSTSVMQLSQQLREMQDRLLATIHEKDALELKHAKLLEEKEQVVKSREELKVKCQSLEIEKERSSMEGSCLSNSLQKANQNSRSPKAQSLPCCHPPELYLEVTHMRKVIDSLKKMVLQQRQCLVELESKTSFSSVRSSMSRSVKAISNVELDMMPNGSSRNSGSESSQSWELVNGVQQHAEDAKLLHQASRTLPERVSSRVAAASNSVQNGGSAISNAPSTGAQPVRRASTEVIYRKTEGDSLRQKKVKTEYIRSSQDLANTHLAIWMDHHSQQQTAATDHGDITLPDTSPVPIRGHLAGHPQQQSQQWATLLKKDAADVPHSSTAPSQPLPSQFVQNPPVYYNLERQMSPIRDLPSSYDNVPPTIPFNRVANTINMVRNSDGTSLHVLNQSVMAGARVLRNSADGFAGNRSNALPPASGMTRGSPHEHSDLSSGQTQTHAVNYPYLPSEPVASQTNTTNRAGADRKCPVCGQDFTHISMDEFQTHVFECFDDAEDTSAPETLQPQKNTDSEDRVCPMCEKEFNASFTQTAFEQHVESHFDDTIDRFELLDVTRT